MNTTAPQDLITPELASKPSLVHQHTNGTMHSSSSSGVGVSSSKKTPQSVIDELQYYNRRPRTSGKSPRTEDLVRKKAESEARFRSLVSDMRTTEKSETDSPKQKQQNEHEHQHQHNSMHNPRHRQRRRRSENHHDHAVVDDDNPIDYSGSSDTRHKSKSKKRSSKSGHSRKSRSSRSSRSRTSKGSLPGASMASLEPSLEGNPDDWGIKSVVSDGMEKWTHFENSESEFSGSASEYTSDPQIDSILPPTLMTPNSMAAKSLLAAGADTPSSMESSAGFPPQQSLRNLVMMDSSESGSRESSSRRSSSRSKRKKKKSSRSMNSSSRHSSSRHSSSRHSPSQSPRNSPKNASPVSQPRPLSKKTQSMRSEGTYSLPTPSVIAAGVQQVADQLDINMAVPSSPSSPSSQEKQDRDDLFMNDDDSAKLRKKAARSANRRSNVKRRRKHGTPEDMELMADDAETMSTISYDPVLDLMAAAKVHEDTIHREASGRGEKVSGDDEHSKRTEEEKQKLLAQVVTLAKKQKMMERAKIDSTRNLADVLEASIEGGETTEDEAPSKQSSSTHQDSKGGLVSTSTETPLADFMSTKELTSAFGSSQDRHHDLLNTYVDVEAGQKRQPQVRRVREEEESPTLKEKCARLVKSPTFIAFTAILLIIVIVIVSVLIALNRPTSNVEDAPQQPRPTPSGPVLNDAEIDALIKDLSPTEGASSLLDSESPQSQALAWLQNSDFRGSRNQIIQRFALATLFFSTEGRDWGNTERVWLSDTDECEWFSTAVDDPCDEEGNYVHLEIGTNRLNGGLPEELSLLTSLKSIRFPGNSLFGSLPSSLQALGSLTNLNLDDNEYERKIPPSLLNLVNLKILSLNMNRFTGDLPTDIGRLSRLEVLSLAGNRISSGIPDGMYTLKELKRVNLEFNEMSGPIKPEIGNLEKLEHLKLDVNLFSQGIPTEFGILKDLKTFTCNECSLFGALPTQFGFLGKLETLELEQNQLEGTLPAELGEVTSLRRVDLSENAIKGSLPTSLGKLTDIKSFDVKGNFMTGTVPSELGGIQSRDFIFYLDSTQITGSIPFEVCNVLNQNEGIMLIDVGQVQPCECTGCHTSLDQGTGRKSGWEPQISRGFDIFDDSP